MEQYRPLAGVTVVELATFVAAPYAARAMADWGADVIKIEPPKGDPMRMMGGLLNMPTDNERENPAYDQQNANKRGIVLNLKHPEGMAVLHRLLAKADIFITNNRQEALERMGLSYEQLSPRYPALVYGQVSGRMGPTRTGPDSTSPPTTPGAASAAPSMRRAPLPCSPWPPSATSRSVWPSCPACAPPCSTPGAPARVRR